MRQSSLIMAPTRSTLKAGVHFVWNRGNVTRDDEQLGKKGSKQTRSVYLVHSSEMITEPQIRDMFTNVTNVTRHVWPAAYPREHPAASTNFPPIKLAPNLFYTSSIESVASSMETSALSSRNIANLLTKELGK